jgi:hypothetical protein
MSDLIVSFDDAMDTFEQGGDKAEKRALAKQEKYDQMNIRVSKMRSAVMKQKSLIDSNMDTIQIQLDLSVMEKEYAVANKLFTALFPEEIAADAATAAAAE